MFVGVDGCQAGWFAVALSDEGYRTAVFPNIGALWATYKDAELILIDVPIGLPEEHQRQCDTDAQQMLGARRSSIFPVPVRSAVYAPSYAKANETNRNITGKGVSKQTWNITPKIREVDAFLRTEPLARQRIRETHPELIFAGLAGAPMQHSKKQKAGLQERLAVLSRYEPETRAIYDESVNLFPRRSVSRDDILDALAVAVAARLGNLHGIPKMLDLDARGLPMQIVYTRGNRLVRVHHAQITVNKADEAAARAFYIGLLGLREIPKPPSLAARGGFWVTLGGMEIHISIEDNDENRHATKAHIAYQVDNLDYWREILTGQGLDIGESVPIPGYKRFEFRDPFGNRVEFIQPL